MTEKIWKTISESVTTTVEEIKRKVVKTKDRRELTRIIFRRQHIKISVVLGLASGDGYGHWWVVIDGAESYGWWPSRPLSGIKETIQGVPGVLNANTPAWARAKIGLNTVQDPHHNYVDELEEFNPIVDDDRTTDQVITAIRSFATSYAIEEWAYPATASNESNCHTFQDELIAHCKLEKGTVRQIGIKGKVESENPPKKSARRTDE